MMRPMASVGTSPNPASDPRWIASLKDLPPADIADQIEVIPINEMRAVLRQIPDELAAETITELNTSTQLQLVESMRPQRLSGIVGEMFSDDAADVLGQLSAERLREVMSGLSPEDATEISDLMKYPDDTAGGLMQTEFIAVSEEMTIGEAIEAVRRDEEATSEGAFYVYVVDGRQRLRGVLKVRDLLFRGGSLKVRDVMIPDVRCVSVHADQEEIAQLFQKYNYHVVPVIDDFQRLRGVVTGDDVLDVVQEEATEDMQRMVGLTGEEMVDTPWKTSVRNRLPWLYVNLSTAFLAAWVVSLFEATIASYAALAVLLPVIAGQGGNAGTQTLTIMVRSLALGELRLGQQHKVLIKEMLIGLMTGIAVGFVVGLVSWIWKQNIMLGVVACAAMILNMLAAAVAGVLIPLGLKAIRVDPALASAIMLTTVTDVFGFFLFLGLAMLGLHYFPLS